MSLNYMCSIMVPLSTTTTVTVPSLSTTITSSSLSITISPLLCSMALLIPESLVTLFLFTGKAAHGDLLLILHSATRILIPLTSCSSVQLTVPVP